MSNQMLVLILLLVSLLVLANGLYNNYCRIYPYNQINKQITLMF